MSQRANPLTGRALRHPEMRGRPSECSETMDALAHPRSEPSSWTAGLLGGSDAAAASALLALYTQKPALCGQFLSYWSRVAPSDEDLLVLLLGPSGFERTCCALPNLWHKFVGQCVRRVHQSVQRLCPCKKVTSLARHVQGDVVLRVCTSRLAT